MQTRRRCCDKAVQIPCQNLTYICRAVSTKALVMWYDHGYGRVSQEDEIPNPISQPDTTSSSNVLERAARRLQEHPFTQPWFIMTGPHYSNESTIQIHALVICVRH